MIRWLASVVVAVLAAVLLTELVALPVATHQVADTADRCYDVEAVRVTGVDRPATPGLLVGRATGVELEITGAVVDDLRIEVADVSLEEVALPWAFGEPEPTAATARLEITEADLLAALTDRLPLDVDPVLELRPGTAAIGVAALPLRLDLEVEVRDGSLRVAPADRLPAWFTSLGLDLEFDLPEDVRVERIDVRQGYVEAIVLVDRLSLTQEASGAAPRPALAQLAPSGSTSSGAEPTPGPDPTPGGCPQVGS